MKLLWHVGEPDLYWLDDAGNVVRRIQVSNAVRNADNGRRSLQNPEDVVMTTPGAGWEPKPYQPSGFPSGHWRVTAVLPRTSDYLAPFFLATDAWHLTPEWSVTPAGDYGEPTGEMVRDAGFGIHYAKGTSTTLGCLRVLNRSDLETLAAAVKVELDAGRTVPFEVIA